MAGERLARPQHREIILKTALREGWLDLGNPRVAQALSSLSDSEVQVAVTSIQAQAPAASPLEQLEAAPPPGNWALSIRNLLTYSRTQAKWEKWGVNVAAASIIKDALLFQLREKLGVPPRGPDWVSWERACEKIRAAVTAGVHEDLIRSRLAAQYRRTPPPIVKALWIDDISNS